MEQKLIKKEKKDNSKNLPCILAKYQIPTYISKEAKLIPLICLIRLKTYLLPKIIIFCHYFFSKWLNFLDNLIQTLLFYNYKLLSMDSSIT